MASRTPTPDASIESATTPETRGIELIRDDERHGRPRDLFAVWAAPNVSILNFTVGATLIFLGMEIWQAVLVVVAAALLWIFPGIIATSGPAAGTAGSVITRAIYGVIGNKPVVAFTGWLIGAVYLALNWLAASFLAVDLLSGFGVDGPATAVVVTIVIAAVTVFVAVYGHALILRLYPIVTGALFVVFLLAAAFALPQADWGYRAAEPLSGVALFSAVTIGFTIVASTPLSYNNSPDMARYLPATSKPSHIVAATALGGALPATLFTIVGVLTATAILDSDAGIETALLSLLPGWLGPLLVVGVILNTIALNGMTTYTSSMALQAIGLPLRRIPAAVIVGLIGTALTIYLVLSTTLLDAVNLMLQFLIIVAAPTISVFAADVIRRRGRYDGIELFDEGPTSRFWYTGGWSIPGILAVVVGGAGAALCLSTSVWTGPIAAALGNVDLSVPVGIILPVVIYVILVRTPLGRERPPAHAAPSSAQEGIAP